MAVTGNSSSHYHLAVTTEDGSIYLYSILSNGHASQQLLADGMGISAPPPLAMSTDGRWLFWFDTSLCELTLWDLSASLRTDSLPLTLNQVNGLSVSNEGNLLAIGGDSKRVRIASLSHGNIPEVFEGKVLEDSDGCLISLKLSPDGSHLALILSGGELRLFSLPSFPLPVTGSPPNSMTPTPIPLRQAGLMGRIRTMAFSPDGTLLATGCEDGHIRIWITRRGILGKDLPAHKDAVLDLDFSPDGNSIISSGTDNTLFLSHIQTACCRAIECGKGARTNAVIVSREPVAPRVLLGDDDGYISIWEWEDIDDHRSPPGPQAEGGGKT
jgi:WD40 repeat protein